MPRRLTIPESVESTYKPLCIRGPGRWLILNDAHFPYHDVPTLSVALEKAKKDRVTGFLLNGDLLDCHWISRHNKEPSAPRYCEEIAVGNQFLDYLKYRFPKTRIVFKAGNHEERLRVYIIQNAEALFGLEAVTLPSLLELRRRGIEWVEDKRVIRLGKLNAIHGHEYPGGIQSPVNPARGLFLRAKASSIAGHHHQTSEHFEPDIKGTPHGAWSIGCACDLNPKYAPLNRWNHGFAIVELDSRGDFAVRNFRVIDGTLV